MPPRGSENAKSSRSSFSPYALVRLSASTTCSPSRGPGGTEICSLSWRLSAASASATSCSYAVMRALPLACRARRHADPLELALERAPARLVDLLFLREPLVLLLEPARVVAFPRDAVPAVELEDPARDVVEEVPVVGDRDDGAVVLLEVAFEPRNRLRVEVVRRFVEEQQVRLRQQQPAQRDAAPLTSGQRRDVGVGRREPERVHRDVELAVEIPAVDRVDLGLQLALFGEQLVEVGVGIAHRVAHLFEAVEQPLRVRDAVGHVAEHVLGRIEVRFLREEAHREAGRDPTLTRVAVVLARDDPQQRRLARPVQAEHADLGAGIHGDVDAAQHLFVGRVDPTEVAHREDELRGHERPTVPGRDSVTVTAGRAARPVREIRQVRQVRNVRHIRDVRAAGDGRRRVRPGVRPRIRRGADARRRHRRAAVRRVARLRHARAHRRLRRAGAALRVTETSTPGGDAFVVTVT